MLNILLVEDDKDLNMLVSSYLKEAGYDVVAVLNGLEALTKYREQSFDLIIKPTPIIF